MSSGSQHRGHGRATRTLVAGLLLVLSLPLLLPLVVGAGVTLVLLQAQIVAGRVKRRRRRGGPRPV